MTKPFFSSSARREDASRIVVEWREEIKAGAGIDK